MYKNINMGGMPHDHSNSKTGWVNKYSGKKKKKKDKISDKDIENLHGLIRNVVSQDPKKPFNLPGWNHRYEDQLGFKQLDAVSSMMEARDNAPGRGPGKWQRVGDAFPGWNPPGCTEDSMTYEHPDLHDNDLYVHAHKDGLWEHGSWEDPEKVVIGVSANQEQAKKDALESFKQHYPGMGGPRAIG